MSYLVLVVLSLLWLGFFFPSLLQSRRTSSPLGSVESFQESLTRISTGHAVTAEEAAAAATRRPRRSRREIARQRDVLTALSAGVVGSIALMLTFGGPLRWLVVAFVAALAGYVGKLRLRVLHETAPRRMPVPAPKTFPADTGVVPSVRRRSPQDADDADMERLAG